MHISNRKNLHLHSIIEVFFLIKLFLFLVEKFGLEDDKFLKCFKENPGTTSLKTWECQNILWRKLGNVRKASDGKLEMWEHPLMDTWDFENAL